MVLIAYHDIVTILAPLESFAKHEVQICAETLSVGRKIYYL